MIGPKNRLEKPVQKKQIGKNGMTALSTLSLLGPGPTEPITTATRETGGRRGEEVSEAAGD